MSERSIERKGPIEERKILNIDAFRLALNINKDDYAQPKLIKTNRTFEHQQTPKHKRGERGSEFVPRRFNRVHRH